MKKGIIAFTSSIIGGTLGIISTYCMKQKQVKHEVSMKKRFYLYYNLLNQWLMIKQENKSLEQYFVERNNKNIIIYGMGEMGNRLYDELKSSIVHIDYAIDINADDTYSELQVKTPEEGLKNVTADVIVITAIYAYDDIYNTIHTQVSCPIISLEDIIFNL